MKKINESTNYLSIYLASYLSDAFALVIKQFAASTIKYVLMET